MENYNLPRNTKRGGRRVWEIIDKDFNVHWDNIGIIIGVSSHELCDVCMYRKDCKQSAIAGRYIIECSKCECIEKYKETLEYIKQMQSGR